jgi:hypothetical protein
MTLRSAESGLRLANDLLHNIDRLPYRKKERRPRRKCLKLWLKERAMHLNADVCLGSDWPVLCFAWEFMNKRFEMSHDIHQNFHLIGRDGSAFLNFIGACNRDNEAFWTDPNPNFRLVGFYSYPLKFIRIVALAQIFGISFASIVRW